MTERPPQTVLVTGATGFLGRHVVAAAVRAGHTVRAMVRPGTDPGALPWGLHPRLETVHADLRGRRDLPAAISGCDVVVHLAATKSGDFASRFAGTVVATENLLSAMDEAGVTRLVHCSTFSVYRSGGVPVGGLFDEAAPLEDDPLRRDPYAQVKLVQEEMVRQWAATDSRELIVLRPGLIYGPGELWHALLGVEVLPSLWLRAGWRTTLPMAWVENVADAFTCALARRPLAPVTVNIVDDRLPTVGAYLRAVRPLVERPPRLVLLGYPVTRALVRAVDSINHAALGGRLKLPGGLSPAPFEARFRPMRYTNERAREALGWAPRVQLPEAVVRARDAASLVRLDSALR